MFELSIKFTGVDEAMKQFDYKVVNKAAQSAINKIGDQAVTFISRRIREEFNIKASNLKKFLKITKRATGDGLVLVIEGRTAGLSLGYFDPKQAGVKATKKQFSYTKRAVRTEIGQNGGALSVLVKLASGRKTISEDDETKGKPFLVRFKSGHLAVVSRKGSSRLPLHTMFGPGVAGLMRRREFQNQFDKFVFDKWNQVFPHELEFFKEKMAGPPGK